MDKNGITKDHIDFGRLQQEVLSAIESDGRYSRENDAKFRAVDQKVATYEEFRDIVLAAHLKPLQKTDKMPEVFVQKWNSAFNRHARETGPTKVPTLQPSKVPTSSLRLVNDWRRLAGDKEKLKYLLDVGAERLRHIFTTEISGGLLGDMLRVLLSHPPERAAEVAGVLDAMSSAKRFKLDLQMLSSEEKETCHELFVKLSAEACLGTSRNSGPVEGSSPVGEVRLILSGSGKTASLEEEEEEEEVKKLIPLFQVTL